ncbi:hypothetical protein M0638_04875 [Roseomonas sp. NAR14]|uniref:Lipoprotein n=1 Tax=Roseomonas acroporae TaxID=2937791 RepID=A0A9X1Y620_9PROT|nr:hypothetical protein [Roseomonas acroporae]MCK8783715.1 hypothetical protein [Roseomonas acroporae]
MHPALAVLLLLALPPLAGCTYSSPSPSSGSSSSSRPAPDTVYLPPGTTVVCTGTGRPPPCD